MRHDLLQSFLTCRTARRFDALVEGTRECLLAAAWRVLGDLQLAEDAVQEVYMKVLEEQEDGRSIRSGIGWLAQTTIFRARTKRRTLARIRARDAYTASMVAGAYMTEETARHGEVRDAVAGLASDLRGPVELRYFGGLSTREIADVFDLTPRAVDKRLERAREELAPRLAPAVLGGLHAALRQPVLVPEVVAAAAAHLQGPAIRAAAGVSLPAAAATSTLAIGGVLLLAIGLAVGGVVLALSGATDDDEPKEPAPVVTSRQDAAEDVPAPRLAGVPPLEPRAESAQASEEAPAAVAPSSTALTIRVVGPNGALVRRGRLKFGAVSYEDAREIRELARADPDLRSWTWLQQWFPLADHNPIELPAVPAAFRDQVFAVHVDVDGLYGPPEMELDATLGPVRIVELTPTWTREVLVRDAVTGEGIPGAELKATRHAYGEVDITPYGRGYEEPPRSVTRANGSATLRGLTPQWPCVTAAVGAYHPAHVQLDGGAARLAIDLVPLAAGATLDVQVFLEPDLPFASATVVLDHDRRLEGTTGADGHVRFSDLPPGEARVRLSSETSRRLFGPAPLVHTVTQAESPDAPKLLRVQLEPERTTHARLGFVPRGTGVVVVRVEAPNGRPQPGQMVQLAGPVCRTGFTDAGGRATFDGLPAGRYSAYVWQLDVPQAGEPTPTQWAHEDIQVGDGDTKQVEFVLGDRTLRVHLVFPDDDGPPSPGWVVIRAADGRWQGPADYEEDVVVFRHVAPGPYVLEAGSLIVAEVRRDIRVPADTDPPVVVVRLERGGRVSLRFADPGERSDLLAVRVRLMSEGGETHELELDPAGGFVWTSKPVRAGQWTLVVECPDAPRLERTIEVVDGETLRLEL